MRNGRNGGVGGDLQETTLQTLQLFQEAGPDKVLILSIPVEKANQKYRVTITVEPEPTPEDRGWPPGYFERTVGCWEGELKREPEGDYERRDPL